MRYFLGVLFLFVLACSSDPAKAPQLVDGDRSDSDLSLADGDEIESVEPEAEAAETDTTDGEREAAAEEVENSDFETEGERESTESEVEAPLVTKIVSGRRHTCALTRDGEVYCWGAHDAGQLGMGELEEQCDAGESRAFPCSRRPQKVPDLDGKIVSLDAHEWHTCAVNEAGSAFCWGYNDDHQLGDASAIESCDTLDRDGEDCFRSPVTVKGLPSAVASIACGADHTCAVLRSGELYCWGYGRYGELGGGEVVISDAPQAVKDPPSGVSALFGGVLHTCALTQEGAVYCWGDNDSFECGVNAKSTCKSGDEFDPCVLSPGLVGNLPGKVKAVSAGEDTSSALLEDGSVVSWGAKLQWEEQSEPPKPVAVKGLESGVSAISAHFGRHCALRTNGKVVCNEYNSASYVEESGLPKDLSALSVGGGYLCVLTQAGKVFCKGVNTFGQLGDGTSENSETAREVVW